MNRLVTMSLLATACVGLVLAGALAASSEPATGPAGATTYDADFTKDLGAWKILEAEGKLVAGEGVKFTDLKTTGGLHQEGKPVDVSAVPNVTIEMENAGKERITLYFKVKTGKKADTKEFKVEPGKFTFKYDLKDASEVDLKKIDYMKLFGAGEVNLVVKKITLSK